MKNFSRIFSFGTSLRLRFNPDKDLYAPGSITRPAIDLAVGLVIGSIFWVALTDPASAQMSTYTGGYEGGYVGGYNVSGSTGSGYRAPYGGPAGALAQQNTLLGANGVGVTGGSTYSGYPGGYAGQGTAVVQSFSPDQSTLGSGSSDNADNANPQVAPPVTDSTAQSNASNSGNGAGTDKKSKKMGGTGSGNIVSSEDRSIRIGQTLSGQALTVSGNELSVAGMTYRLAGVSAPSPTEVCAQSNGDAYHCGEAAENALSDILQTGSVSCVVTVSGTPPQVDCDILGQSVNQAILYRDR